MYKIEDIINKIHCFDCLTFMKEMEDKSVDLTITSPPYDNLRDYKGYTFNFEGIAKQLYRITKDGGVVVWVVGDATIKGSETGTSFKQALYFKEIGFNLHDTMIWVKTGQGAVGSIYSYWQNFEYMFILSKGKLKTFNPIEDRKNYACERWANGGRDKTGQSKSRRWVKSEDFGKRFNVWKITPQCESEHPAPFPKKLAEDHILSWSNEGDIVLDPMCGSGTTCKMAQNLKRKYIGIEISQEYCKIAKQRLMQKPLL